MIYERVSTKNERDSTKNERSAKFFERKFWKMNTIFGKWTLISGIERFFQNMNGLYNFFEWTHSFSPLMSSPLCLPPYNITPLKIILLKPGPQIIETVLK